MKQPNRFLRWLHHSIALFVIMMGPCLAVAKDYCLIIGGGPDPATNPVSIERNVIFSRHILQTQRDKSALVATLFCGGVTNDRCVQFRESDTTSSSALRVLAEIFGEPHDVSLRYRAHQVQPLQGAATRAEIKGHFDQWASLMIEGDRLILYVTAHGGSSTDEDQPENTLFYLWGEEEVTASDLAGWLDRLPTKVDVVLIMVQCHAGGFARTIFRDASPEHGLAPQRRAGFFSQRYDRESAGCTPELKEADYEEYSSYFWGALAQQTRDGQALPLVDYNADQQTSLAEAHAYAILHCPSIDVPLRTSDLFLHVISEQMTPTKADAPRAKQSLQGVLSLASPIDRAIIDGLSRQLKLDATTSVTQIEQEADNMVQQLTDLDTTYANALAAVDVGVEKLEHEVLREWPELSTEFTPTLQAILTTEANRFVSFVERLPEYQHVQRLRGERDEAARHFAAAEIQEARWQRLIATLERVTRADRLTKSGDRRSIERFRTLCRLEEGHVTTQAPSR